MRSIGIAVLSIFALGAFALRATSSRAQTPCERLSSVALPHTAITLAARVTSGSFQPPGAPVPLTGLPTFCRVAGTASPTADSLIHFEVWIPLDGAWNGKYEQLGCGGFCGSIGYAAIAEAIRRGYAGAATDDGSQAGGAATFALGHPEKIIDFGYRALKETTDNSKAIIHALTGHAPRRSYFNGCSDGGREGLMEAQRFPGDFDAIIVGSPANFWTNLFAGFAWNQQALLNDPAAYVPPGLLSVVSSAARAQCAGQDGGVPTDPFLNDPRDCHFDPASVQCQAGQDPSTCLSAAQVATLRKIYAGPHDPVTGKLIFPGYEPGTEANAANWPAWITGAAPGGSIQAFFARGFFADFVFQDPSFDFLTLDFASDVAFANATIGPILNSTDPDLRAFRRHGGKIIHYVGWADAAIAPANSINYYNDVRRELRRHGDREISDFYRLFMVPGMAHCGGGDGPNAFGNGVNAPVVDPEHDLLQALDRWVERGVAPSHFIATHYLNNAPASGVQFQRPICAFPDVARWTGGDPDDAASFRCVRDEPDRDPRDRGQ